MIVDAGRVTRALVNLGLSPLASAGLASRAGPESSYDTTALGDGGTSYGLWQLRGPRKDGLMSYAKANGLDPADLDTQARYVVNELGTTEGRAGGLLASAKTDEDVAAGVMAFERPKGWTAANPAGGLGYAQTLAGIKGLLGSGSGDSAAPAPSSGPTPSADETPAPMMQPFPLQPVGTGAEAQQAPAPDLLAGLSQRRSLLGRGGIRPIASILGRRV